MFNDFGEGAFTRSLSCTDLTSFSGRHGAVRAQQNDYYIEYEMNS